MDQRLFTKRIDPQPVTTAGLGHWEELGRDSWTVEEDITIVGVQGAFLAVDEDEVDSNGECQLELSQSGLFDKDGCILHDHLYQIVSAAAAGAIVQESHHYEMFYPPGMGITMREGDTLYCHLAGWVYMGMQVWNCKFYVYYVKGIKAK